MANYAYTPTADRGASASVRAALVVTGIVLVLMMVFGLLMRLEQAHWMSMSPAWFYKLMTLHGAGMVGIAALGSVAIMRHFLGEHVPLSTPIFISSLVLFLVGVTMILVSVFVGDFHGAWTFLYPLPGTGMGMWKTWAAALFLAGLLVIGVGFLLFFLDSARGIIARYGSFGRSLGWPQLFGTDDGNAPPPAVVASTMVTIVQICALVVGASILVMMLVNLYLPSFHIDALAAKGMIYFFGHTFINATIYASIIVVYELLPRYTHRPWKSSRVFLAAWTAAIFMVLFIFPHHLLMDFAYPTWMLIIGQVLGYTSAIPVILVTAFGGLMLVYRSGIRWDLTSRLLVLSLFGWSAGIIPAFIDGTIPVNAVMHNTLWVPGHFHFYLLLGVVAMLFAFMAYLAKSGPDAPDGVTERVAFWAFVAGGVGLPVAFLYEGQHSVPRRYAEHVLSAIPADRFASIGAGVVIVAALLYVGSFLVRVATAGHDHPRANPPSHDSA